MINNSTGHGTVNVPFSQESDTSQQSNQKQSTTANNVKDNQEHESTEGSFGHTVKHGPSPRTIKRDLDNV
ncbi:uncharacterized protein BX663DRAFT_522892 [Cokeromyces recurvatus]|uniref:uncharacterized protein n=1 Tax=Cokeromyces recurvatus TaxID=90255 RepID=UPI00221F5B97|nr:uncharacterized protein BX663DRAFT_522892 [Cokeromyces recurvatus]KAI7899029.1 hypothetical protein BX663DRAFT_522892 [Cokeromyces recurvatus]